MKQITKKITRRQTLALFTGVVSFAVLGGCQTKSKIALDDVYQSIQSLHSFPLTFPFILG